MAQIRIDLNEPLLNGMDIKFQAPCDCTGITGLIVFYPNGDDDSYDNKTFVFKDAHGNVLTGIGNLFVRGSIVKVIVDTVDGIAYLQNADTNGYLEGKFENCLPLSGGSMSGTLETKGLILSEGVDYGDTLPDAGTVGRLFFKKVSG